MSHTPSATCPPVGPRFTLTVAGDEGSRHRALLLPLHVTPHPVLMLGSPLCLAPSSLQSTPRSSQQGPPAVYPGSLQRPALFSSWDVTDAVADTAAPSHPCPCCLPPTPVLVHISPCSFKQQKPTAVKTRLSAGCSRSPVPGPCPGSHMAGHKSKCTGPPPGACVIQSSTGCSKCHRLPAPCRPCPSLTPPLPIECSPAP